MSALQPYEFNHALRTQIQGHLDRFAPQPAELLDLREAAVAIVIVNNSETNQASVLMTLRPQKLNRHAGQYALPGGRLDEGETVVAAARRELHEELGLDLLEEHVLGQLDHFPTRSGFRISPIVMWASGTVELRPEPAEVAEVFLLPLTELDSPDIPRLSASKNSEHPVLSAYFPTLGHYMYAPTAAILYQFREIALRGVSTRAAHYDQPTFAWK
jgi:8-oxo-dGTP pyrophosphatase MutT (NUDIX family)